MNTQVNEVTQRIIERSKASLRLIWQKSSAPVDKAHTVACCLAVTWHMVSRRVTPAIKLTCAV